MAAIVGRVAVTVLSGLSAGCADAAAPSRLVLASTTSTEDSGLFDELIPAFERAHPEFPVLVLAVGSGEALELGRRGDADVLLVHSPAAESVFVAQGHAVERRAVMVNDFVIVGPASDPASIAGSRSAGAALRRIAGARARFISRGDDSGTHRKERALWESAALDPAGDWYVEAGQGMGDVLAIASELRAHALSDRATWLAFRDRLDLVLLVEGDPTLANPYSVLRVTGARNAAGARAFADWLTSEPGQSVIADFGVERFGRPLFGPARPTRPAG